MILSSFEITATHAGPHDFSARVRVFGETDRSRAFVSLDLGVGPGAKVRLFLPPTAYNVASSIAELWPTLVDKPAALGISPEALANVGAAELKPASEVAS